MSKKCFCLFWGIIIFNFTCYSKGKEMHLSYSTFYRSIYRCDVESTELHLKNGFNPNICRGEAGWVDSIPLKVLSGGFKGTYNSRLDNPDFVYNNADIKVFNLLINSRANIKQLPYIWDRIYRYGNWHLNNLNGKSLLPEAQQKLQKQYFVEDANRLLEAMLKAGAIANFLSWFGVGKDLVNTYLNLKAFALEDLTCSLFLNELSSNSPQITEKLYLFAKKRLTDLEFISKLSIDYDYLGSVTNYKFSDPIDLEVIRNDINNYKRELIYGGNHE